MNLRRYNFVLPLALACTLLLTLAACSTTMTVGENVDSAALVTKVETRLAADPQVNPFEIDVDHVTAGMIRLSGAVESQADIDAAIEIARSTNGVRAVINDLTVGERTAGQRMDDATVTTKIEAKLAADPQVSATNIDVDTRDGVVTLSGLVKTAEARTEAEQLARDTEGVRNVDNRIRVQ